MNNQLDLASYSHKTFELVNQYYYAELLQSVQSQAEKIGIIFSTEQDSASSSLTLLDLLDYTTVQLNLETAVACRKHSVLSPKASIDSLASWVLNDVKDGWGKALLREIFTALHAQGIYPHINQEIFNTDPLIEFSENDIVNLVEELLNQYQTQATKKVVPVVVVDS